MPSHNKRNFEYQYNTRAKRNQELDRNRGEYQGVSNADVPSRRENRTSLKGRKEQSVLPLSNTPLYGVDEPDLTKEVENLPFSEMANFCSGSGERLADANTYNLASGGRLPPNAPYVETVENDLSRGSNATRRETPHVQSNIPLGPGTNRASSLDPNMANLVKELVVNTQKEMMTDIISSLTSSFKETLKIETQKIVREVSENQNRTRNTSGESSSYRLEYREPRQNNNESNPGISDAHSHSQNRNHVNFRFPGSDHSQGNPRGNVSQNPNENVQQPPLQGYYNIPPPYGNVNHNQNANRVQLDKWGFQFNGSNMSVEDFFFRIECKQQNSNITWVEIYSNLNNLLSDPVETWYWTFRKNNPNADYDLFKLALSERYPSKDTDVDLWRKLINHKQSPGEAFDDFVDEIERIYYKMNDRPTLPQLISVIRDNVSSEISQYIGLARTNSLVGIKHLAREAEKLVEKLNPVQKNSRPFRKNIHEVSTEETCPTADDHVFIEAFVAPKRDYKIFQCKKCSQKFRVNEETKEEKRIYCYRCGKEGVIVSNCPVCAENR